MHLPDIELHRAATLQEAAAVKQRYDPDARWLAGGTDLLVDLKAGRITAGHLVSVNRIDALRGVSETDGNLYIGALTTITQLGCSSIVRRGFSPILDATGKMAAPQIRNVATVGGNIACAVPCADLPPILTAMRASVALWSPNGERSVPLEAFFVDARKTVLRDDEILTRVLVPRPQPGFGAAYARFALRDGNAIAVAAVATGVTLGRNNTVNNVSIVLGAVAPTPKMVETARTVLVGKRADEEAFSAAAVAAMEAAEPISDVRGSADFRRKLVAVLTRRALETARRRARETSGG